MVVESRYKIIQRCMLPVSARKFLRHFSLPREVWKELSNRPTVPPPFFQERKCKRTHLVVFVVDAVFVLFV